MNEDHKGKKHMMKLCGVMTKFELNKFSEKLKETTTQTCQLVRSMEEGVVGSFFQSSFLIYGYYISCLAFSILLLFLSVYIDIPFDLFMLT